MILRMVILINGTYTRKVKMKQFSKIQFLVNISLLYEMLHSTPIAFIFVYKASFLSF